MTFEENNKRIVVLAFVESRRAKFREDLSDLYLPFYEALIEELSRDHQGDFFAPYSGKRSMDEQTALYLKGRTTEDLKNRVKIVTYARAGDSAHNWGCATDWAEFQPTYAGQDIWNKANWNYFGNCVRKVGLQWGGDFEKIVDKPHCELRINMAWSKIGKIYRDSGVNIAEQTIKSSLA